MANRDLVASYRRAIHAFNNNDLARTRNGRTFETFHVYYYRFDQAGRLIEGHTIPVDQHLADQFWS